MNRYESGRMLKSEPIRIPLDVLASEGVFQHPFTAVASLAEKFHQILNDVIPLRWTDDRIVCLKCGLVELRCCSNEPIPNGAEDKFRKAQTLAEGWICFAVFDSLNNRWIICAVKSGNNRNVFIVKADASHLEVLR